MFLLLMRNLENVEGEILGTINLTFFNDSALVYNRIEIGFFST